MSKSTQTEESKKFEEFSREWWDPKGALFSLHKINPLRFSYFEEKAAGELGGISGKRVLDVGCGGGLLSEEFAKAGGVVTGIDLSPVSIQAASDHAGEGGLTIDYRAVSIDDLRKEIPKKFDMVVCAEVLEHVEDIEGFMRSVLSVLAPGGLFFFSTINKTMKARFLAIFLAEEVLRIVPHGTHTYHRLVKPSTLAMLMERSGVEVREVKGMSFSPLHFEFRISGDTSVNYLGYGKKGG